MVAATMVRVSAATSISASLLFRSHDKSSQPSPTSLGILAFDTAKTMSRLISLYRSLTDDEVDNLQKEVLRSEGVAYLNSRDEAYLLKLACAERLEALDSVANTISVMGRKCSDLGLNRFDLVYADLKQGLIDIGRLEFASRNADRIVEKMEKLTSATASLYSALETLAEMEKSERKLQQWRKNAPAGPTVTNQSTLQKANCDLFESKIAFQRKQVRRYKDASLWSQKMDKCVGLMARIVCVVFMRICVVFGSYMTDLTTNSKNEWPHKHSPQIRGIWVHTEMTGWAKRAVSNSGPMPKTSENRSGSAKIYSRKLKMNLFVPEDTCLLSGCGRMQSRPTTVFHSAPESTVGGSGLALLYANVIILAERFLNTPTSIGEDARGFMYDMLPSRLRTKVRAKLRRSNIMDQDQDYSSSRSSSSNSEDDEEEEEIEGEGRLAQGWRDALEAIMEWLAPVAHDTMRWQSERTLEKQRFDTGPTVLLVQTLHYSDLEKMEAAIVEVLVGLSCIFRCENRSCFGGKIN
ncbi:uncharacterized protein LOC116195933 [Punica granatum]|uniref:DUF3475 domain-containing protein n=2 Tax=Punica granatum TaxID=22663 RepID=A0A218XAS3_PUNGR|nr:uncharacterized protein LOC116195933 [Punica granatum]OWM81796.1 hypothetical protein CDL15_Pgr007834 [Punica granatum]PKI43450.1 hypothetical protein CRG98_036207 [Punica granatum]